MKEKYLYVCENSTTGIFTGIYDAWAARHGHDNNRILVEEPWNYEFFTQIIIVKPDLDKAEKVKRSIIQKISMDAYIMVYNASLSKDKAKADVIYRFLILGFAMGKDVIGHLSNPYVNHMAKMDQNVKNELFHFEGFLRFVKMGDEFLFARVRPENDILLSLTEHFVDRFPQENFVIYDENRIRAAVHQTGKGWFVMENYPLELHADWNQLEEQDEFLNMWKHFVDAIGINERRNEKLQSNMMPNRFREFMPEVEYKKRKNTKVKK